MADKLEFETEATWDIVTEDINQQFMSYAKNQLGRDIKEDDIEDYRVTIKMRTIKFRAWDKMGVWMVGDSTVKDRLNSFPKTWELMQYTGLKDKNGKEIYEGDIVRKPDVFGNLLIGVIEYEAPFYWAVAEGDRAFSVGDKCEVIGNIMENPELLK